jgi:type III secretion protein W
MAHNINLVRPLPMPVSRPVAPKGAGPVSDDRDNDNVRTPAQRKSALGTALEMHDDLSGLVSSMRRSRARDERDSDIHGHGWLDHVLDEDAPEKLVQFRLQLNGLGTPQLATLRTLLLQYFPDTSDAVAILRCLLAENELNELLRERLQQLHDGLLQGSDAQATCGGLNVALKARLNSPRLRASARQLRRSYRDFLAGQEPLDSYELWIDLYGFDRRAMVVDFIEQALASDMYALDPSCSRVEFGELLSTVRQLTTLRSADQLLFKHCWHPQLMTALGVDRPQLLAALLAVVRDGGGLPALFSSVFAAARYTLSDTDKAVFAQGMWRFLKALPHGLWAEVDLQLGALTEVEQLLDRAIVQEQSRGAARRRWEA